MPLNVFATAIALLAAAGGLARVGEWRTLLNRGKLAEAAGQYARAAGLYEEAARLTAGVDQALPDRCLALNNMARMYDTLGRFSDAEAAYRQALLAADQSPVVDRSMLLANLGSLYAQMGRANQGEKMLRQAAAIREAKHRLGDERLAIIRTALAELITEKGAYREAEQLLTDSILDLERLPLKAPIETAVARNNLGVVRFRQGRVADARELFEQALEGMQTQTGPEHPVLIRTLVNLGGALQKSGRIEEAGEKYRRALDITTRYLGPEHPIYGAVLHFYAGYLRATGKKAEGKALEARSNQVLNDSRRRNGIGAVVDANSLTRR